MKRSIILFCAAALVGLGCHSTVAHDGWIQSMQGFTKKLEASTRAISQVKTPEELGPLLEQSKADWAGYVAELRGILGQDPRAVDVKKNPPQDLKRAAESQSQAFREFQNTVIRIQTEWHDPKVDALLEAWEKSVKNLNTDDIKLDI